MKTQQLNFRSMLADLSAYRFFACAFFISSSLCALPLQIDVSAKAAILMNADTGAILFEKEAHLPSYPASITKVATALFVLEGKKIDPATVVSVGAEGLRMKPQRRNRQAVPPYWLEPDGTRMGLIKGEEISIDALLHGMMLISGNDAANVLAESASGSIPQFVDELNAYLKTLGCSNTFFFNPHGLHHIDHKTTAYDMCLIAKRALQNPRFCEIVAKGSYLKPRTNKQPEAQIRQFNHLLRAGRFYDPRAIGVKTGYTSQALNTLVAAAKHEGRTLIAVILGCEKRDDRYTDAKKMFDAAFGEQKLHREFLGLNQRYARIVEGAKSELSARLENPLALDYFPAEEPEAKAYLHWDLPVLPIESGQKVGRVRLVGAHGEELGSVALLAESRIEATWMFRLQEKWRQLFSLWQKNE